MSDNGAEDEPTVYQVDLLTRVEGEGAFRLKVHEGEVLEAELKIQESPRLFEAFLQGRSMHDVSDIVARICGICPVAYQMSAAHALEQALGITPDARIGRLRRLLYCGEWIESHALHVFMLHAPDFLGYESAIAMAKDHREVVEKGLSIRKAGNRLIEVLGGRATHPISPRIGGFTKVPAKKQLTAIWDELASALETCIETVRWTASLPTPEFEQDYVFVSLDGGDEYPLEAGAQIAVSSRDPVPVTGWGDAIVETHVERSNALHSRLADGTPYLCGPMARFALFRDKLHPTALDIANEVSLSAPVNNPYRSIVVRAVETVHALADALDIIDGYERPEQPYATTEARAGVGFGATEAPRGLLWHRYEIDGDGLVVEAQIVPPTSQNQARIEADLAGLGPELAAMDHAAATIRCEQLIRAYDPCISCATHFLDLKIETLDS